MTRPGDGFRAAKARHLRLGRRGERLAAILLRELGLEVLARNFRSGADEIDLVARDGDILCFVEVKTRRREILATPAQAVGPEKQRRLIRAAKGYRRELGRPPVLHRYDIVELILDGFNLHQARFWPGAFREDDN